MKSIIKCVFFVFLLSYTSANATPVFGQPVIYRADSTHEYACTIGKIVDPNPATQEVNLVCTSWVDTNWWDTTSGSITTHSIAGVYHGNTDNRWRENPDFPVAGDAGPGFGTTTVILPGITGGVSARALTTSFTPGTGTSPTFVQYRATASATVPLLGTAQEGRVRLRLGATCGAAVEWPQAVGIQASANTAIAVSTSVRHDGTISALVPAAWCVIIDTVIVAGTPTLVLVSNATLSGAQIEQPL